MRKTITTGLACRAAAGAFSTFLILLAGGASPLMALNMFDVTIDRTVKGTVAAGGTRRSLSGMKLGQFKKLSEKKKVYLDLKIRLDGKVKYAVMTSEEEDERRYNVDCRAGAYGRLPMGEGVEYYIKTGKASGMRIDLSIFPGSRSTHPDNDVSCVADRGHPDSAILRVRGIYKVLNNDFGDRLVVELRPLRRDSLDAEERRKLP
jgi:hypothetical protein